MGGSLVPIPKSTREKQTWFTGLSLSCHLKKQFPRSTEKGKKRRSWSSLTSYLPQQPYLQHLQVIGQLFENFQGLETLHLPADLAPEGTALGDCKFVPTLRWNLTTSLHPHWTLLCPP